MHRPMKWCEKLALRKTASDGARVEPIRVPWAIMPPRYKLGTAQGNLWSSVVHARAFNPDADWLAPGWYLGFGKLNPVVLMDADGTRHPPQRVDATHRRTTDATSIDVEEREHELERENLLRREAFSRLFITIICFDGSQFARRLPFIKIERETPKIQNLDSFEGGSL